MSIVRLSVTVRAREGRERNRTSQDGAALVYVALFLAVVLGATAIGVDVARLAHTATEVQTIADASARSGALALAEAGGTPGVGITRAHLIGGKNHMDGAEALPSDLLVDEGTFDVATREFECCTNNSPCCTGGSWGDQTCVAGTNCAQRSAALAIPVANVSNIFAGLFDFMQGGKFTSTEETPSNANTLVRKLAVATAVGPGGGCEPPPECIDDPSWTCYCANGVAPCLPIAAPSCQFPPACTGAECQLPALQVSNNTTDTAAWTVFQANPANANRIRDFLDPGTGICDAPGPGTTIPPQDVSGSDIDVTNGVNGVGSGGSTPFSLMECIFQERLGCSVDGEGNIAPGPGTVFTIPVFQLEPCTASMTGTYPIIGFATVQITNVVLGTGPDETRRIEIQTLGTNSDTGQPQTGACVGTDCSVALVR
jgi:hypothetical protein